MISSEQIFEKYQGLCVVCGKKHRWENEPIKKLGSGFCGWIEGGLNNDLLVCFNFKCVRAAKELNTSHPSNQTTRTIRKLPSPLTI